MTKKQPNSYFSPNPYIPSSLSEIYDLLGAMVLDAPTFIDKCGDFPDRNIDSRFHQLTESYGLMRKKIGEERYAGLIDLATRAKALFAADPEDTNGKTDQGYKLLFEMERIIQDVRNYRSSAKLLDDEGEVTGD